jgi:hypothetical protein
MLTVPENKPVKNERTKGGKRNKTQKENDIIPNLKCELENLKAGKSQAYVAFAKLASHIVGVVKFTT